MVLTPLARGAYSQALEVCAVKYGVNSNHIRGIVQTFSNTLFRHYADTGKNPPSEYYLWRLFDEHITAAVKQLEMCAESERRADKQDAAVEPSGELFQ